MWQCVDIAYNAPFTHFDLRVMSIDYLKMIFFLPPVSYTMNNIRKSVQFRNEYKLIIKPHLPRIQIQYCSQVDHYHHRNCGSRCASDYDHYCSRSEILR